MLQEGEGEQGHQRVSVQARPRAALEVIKPKLFLELLVRLLARALIVAASVFTSVSAGRLER